MATPSTPATRPSAFSKLMSKFKTPNSTSSSPIPPSLKTPLHRQLAHSHSTPDLLNRAGSNSSLSSSLDGPSSLNDIEMPKFESGDWLGAAASDVGAYRRPSNEFDAGSNNPHPVDPGPMESLHASENRTPTARSNTLGRRFQYSQRPSTVGHSSASLMNSVSGAGSVGPLKARRVQRPALSSAIEEFGADHPPRSASSLGHSPNSGGDGRLSPVFSNTHGSRNFQLGTSANGSPSHNRSRSELPPSSPKIANLTERTASTLTYTGGSGGSTAPEGKKPLTSAALRGRFLGGSSGLLGSSSMLSSNQSGSGSIVEEELGTKKKGLGISLGSASGREVMHGLRRKVTFDSLSKKDAGRPSIDHLRDTRPGSAMDYNRPHQQPDVRSASAMDFRPSMDMPRTSFESNGRPSPDLLASSATSERRLLGFKKNGSNSSLESKKSFVRGEVEVWDSGSAVGSAIGTNQIISQRELEDERDRLRQEERQQYLRERELERNRQAEEQRQLEMRIEEEREPETDREVLRTRDFEHRQASLSRRGSQASAATPPGNSLVLHERIPPIDEHPPASVASSSVSGASRRPLQEVYRPTNVGYAPVVNGYPKDRIGGGGQGYLAPQEPVRAPSPNAGQSMHNGSGAIQYQNQSQPTPQMPTSVELQSTKPTVRKSPSPMIVNGKTYYRAGLLGKGGSSRVYRALDPSNNVYAIKKVDISRNDAELRSSFINEISLLRKLVGKPQVIRLIDAEICESKKALYMVMEPGETDLNNLLIEQQGKMVSMNFVRYIWEQMLEAVHVMHNENIVHTDLKPGNFVLVKGRLKLIDFGISKAITGDTTNIGREQQVGTANYMPPEALLDSGMGSEGQRWMKLGRAADVWSLGCILHQMIFSRTPFSHIRDIGSKIIAIQNPNYKFVFPATTTPMNERGEPIRDLTVSVGESAIDAIKNCLRFYPKERATIPELLEGPFLRADGGPSVPMSNPTSKSIGNDHMEMIVRRTFDLAKIGGLDEKSCQALAAKLVSELGQL